MAETLRLRRGETQSNRGAYARGTGQSRNLFAGLDGDTLARARWSDQFHPGKKLKGLIEKRVDVEASHLLKILKLGDDVYAENNFLAVHDAFHKHSMISLPLRLVNPVLTHKGPITPESEGVSLKSIGITHEKAPGCFVCGGEEGIYNNLIGSVKSENEYFTIANMFDRRGISTYFDPSLIGKTAFNIIKSGTAELNYYSLNIGACDAHRPFLKKISNFADAKQGNLSRGLIELFWSSNIPEHQMCAADLEPAGKNRSILFNLGFRFF
jgi:hypothetical protein